MADALNHRQTLFVAAYLDEDSHTKGNATASAKAAGYAKPNKYGPDLLVNPGIAARIAAHEQALQAAVLARGIAVRTERIKAQQDRWERMRRVITARAAEYAHEPGAPGADTGLLVRTYKQIGQGPAMRLVEEWSVDTGLLGEFRQLEQHTAKELGQWSDKAEIGGSLDARVELSHAPTDPAEVVSILGILARAGALSGVAGVAEVLPAGADGAADGVPPDEPA